ncbi:MAG: hypothetical protein FJ104_17750, partial [Deltaproteobacteria bacterium]|nr:hypothetical protein [Deltaproteobacteria bacterium]
MRGQVRPKFRITTELSTEEVERRVARQLRAPPRPLRGLVAPGKIELHVPAERRRFWSPELGVVVSATPEGSALIGRYGPHPHVWSAYLAVSVLLGIAGFGAGVWAFAQAALGGSPTALFGLLVPAVGGLLLLGVARLGRGLSGDEIEELRDFLEAALDDAGAVSVPPRSGVRAAAPPSDLRE